MGVARWEMECGSIGEVESWEGLPGSGGSDLRGKVADFYAFFHDFPHFYAQIRAVFTRFYAFLRVRLFLDANYTNERELGTGY